MGLNIIELSTRNNATMLKLLLNLYTKSDSLWVKWAHTYYIKGYKRMDMKGKASYSWIMKAILKHRESLVCMQTTWNHIMHNKFTMKKVYMKMRSIDHDHVPWKHILFGNTARPRAMITLWLTFHGRLPTKERLHSFGLMDSSTCCLFLSPGGNYQPHVLWFH